MNAGQVTPVKTYLIVRSQRQKAIPDPLAETKVCRRFHAAQRWESRPTTALRHRGPGQYFIDAERGHHFKITLTFAGFLPLTCEFHATKEQTLHLTAHNRVQRLPLFSQLSQSQRDLAGMLPAKGSPQERWESLSDNQSATFYQLTVALTRCAGGLLANHIASIARVGGSKLKCPGRKRPVDGWRIHVAWRHSANIEHLLKEVGFQRDTGATHATHTNCGYVTGYREADDYDPKLQIVLNNDGSGADVDLDVGWAHKSAPRDVYEKLIAKYSGIDTLFKVNCKA